jgi:hypothetical protein
MDDLLPPAPSRPLPSLAIVPPTVVMQPVKAAFLPVDPEATPPAAA